MENLSLKLEDEIFSETEEIISKVKKNRNKFINEAIEFYNRLHKRRLLSEQLSKESKMVTKDSLEVLAEFEKLFDEGQAICNLDSRPQPKGRDRGWKSQASDCHST